MLNIRQIDWVLVVPIFLIMCMGLVTNYPVEGFSIDTLFFKQLIFVFSAILIMIFGSHFPIQILKSPSISFVLYMTSIVVLLALLIFAPEINGAHSWFPIGPIAIQPVDFVKIVLCLVLANYFASRHIYIKRIIHVVISFVMTTVLFLLVFLQPDLGSSVTLIAIWIGMIFVAEISKKHIAYLTIFAVILSAICWSFLNPGQQDRVLSFFDPVSNLQTSGYNTYQSEVAIGSGVIFGKGIGEGTQSKLDFLPLYESDFIFAAFAEEWGFIGVIMLLLLFGIVLWRLLFHAIKAKENFYTLFIVGYTTWLSIHILLHIGVNSGIFPVTGITLPFMSYGGSHLIASAIGIAIILHMARYSNSFRVSDLRRV